MACTVQEHHRPMKLSLCSTLLFLSVTGLHAQANLWPLQLSVPQAGETVQDSLKIRYSLQQSLFEKSLKSVNEITWKPVDSIRHLEQNIIYEQKNDFNYDIRNHYIDLSGAFLRDLPLKGSSLGLSWTPVLNVHRNDTVGNARTTLDIGPVARYTWQTVPFYVRGGFSAIGWNDSLRTPLTDVRLSDSYERSGFYGALDIGDYARRLPYIPVYLSARLFGRSVKESGLGAIIGSGLLATGTQTGDSLFVYYGDSLSNGKEAYLGEGVDGTSRYTNTPWRIERSIQVMGGVRGRERFHLTPALVYGFSTNSITYPTTNNLNDQKISRHFVNALGATDTSLNIFYNGGIRFGWEQYDKLFAADLGERADSYNRDSLSSNLGDYVEYAPRMDHQIGVKLPLNLLLGYKYALWRTYTEYPNFYLQDLDTVENDNDKDRLMALHQVSVSTVDYDKWRVQLFGELSDYTLNYLRGGLSGANYNERRYAVGLNCTYAPLENLQFSEYGIAEARITDYQFKENHREPLARPPYSRSFRSVLEGTWKVNDHYIMTGKWTEKYDDDGYWYGSEYRRIDSLTGLPEKIPEYYAIVNKSIYYILEFSSIVPVSERLIFQGGLVFSDAYDREYKKGTYQIKDYGRGYIIEPFIKASVSISKIMAEFHLRRTINTIDEEKWDPNRYWDFKLQVTGQF
jgi:hypothetical protein